MGKDKHQCPVKDCRREYSDIRMLQLHAKDHGVFTTPKALKSQQQALKASKKHHLDSPLRLKEKSKKKRRPRDDSPHPLKYTTHSHPARSILKLLGTSQSQPPPTTPQDRTTRCTIDLRTPSLSPDSSSDDGGIEIITPPRTRTDMATPAASLNSTPTSSTKSPKGRPTWATRPRSPDSEDSTSRQTVEPATPPHSIAPPVSLVKQVSSVPSPFAILSQKHFAHQLTPGHNLCPGLGERNAYDLFVTYALDDHPPNTPENLNAPTLPIQDEMEIDELDEDDPEPSATNLATDGDRITPPGSFPTSNGSDNVDQPATPVNTGKADTTSEKKACGMDTATPERSPPLSVTPLFQGSPKPGAEVSLLRAIGDLFYAVADLSASQIANAPFSQSEAKLMGTNLAELKATALVKQVAQDLNRSRAMSEPPRRGT